MNINITARNINLTNSIKLYIKKRALKLNKFTKLVKDINVVINKENKLKDSLDIEVLLEREEKKIIIKSAENNIYNTINKGFAKMEWQINKYKVKITNCKK